MTLAADLDTWRAHLAAVDLPAARTVEADAERIDLLRSMEELKSTLCAIQAEVEVAFDASQRSQQAAEGEPAERQGRGVAHQIAMARRESPHRGGVLLGMAKDLHAELPHTLTAMREGRLSEYRAQIIVTETSGLDPVDRATVDHDLCCDPETLEGVGTRRLESMARKAAQTIDPAAACRRARRAESERHVSLRPAPDSMTWLTALVPMTHGVAAYAGLSRATDSFVATGDAQGRSRGQVMADLFVELLTGQTAADDVSVCVDLVISDTALLGGGTEPAVVPGYGTVPAEIARHLIGHAIDPDTPAGAWVRALYADPTGRLVALTTRQRFTSDALHAFLRLRDQGLCRTPWCDAPIAHDDHVETVQDGGQTSDTNAQGLCRACNHAKQAARWRQRVPTGPPGRHRVGVTTPTGHIYLSTAPPPPRPSRPRAPAVSPAEQRFARLLLAA